MNFLKSTFIVSFFTLISRLFGFIRDIFFAKYLGTGMLSDIFLTAFKLPNFFRNIFAEGAFNSAFIPIFSSELVKDENNKELMLKFSKNVFSILLYFLLIFSLFIEIFMPYVINIIAAGFSSVPEKYKLTIILSRITFPYLIFISLVSFMSGILNSFNKFAVVSICPVILNITFIMFSLLSPLFNKNIAYILSYAVLVGGLLQFIWLFYFTVKNKILLYPTYIKIDNLTKTFFKNFCGSFLSSGIIQISSIVDSIMAATIPSAISFIYYADRITQLPLALIGTAISISILPTLSKKIATNDKDIFNIQEQSIFIALFLGLPCAIGLFYLSNLAIPVLFERGKFTASDSLAVIGCLKLYAVALPIFILIKILQTIFYANKDTKTPMIASITTLILNITLNLIFMRIYSFRGIVLSTVIASFANILILFLILYKKNKIKFSNRFYLQITKIFYTLIFMYLTMCLTNKLIPNSELFFLKLIKLVFVSGLSGIVYIILSILMNLINIDFLKKFKNDRIN